METKRIRTAVLSVSDKTGLAELALKLSEMDVTIFSTGGTFRALTDAGVQAIPVEELTRFPEMMDGRVKTLHPAVFAGVLARRSNKQDMETLLAHQLRPIDLVAVNLYPFQKVVARADAEEAEIIENIDIGGPSMLRAAAKNFQDVAAVVDPGDYGAIVTEMAENDGALGLATRRRLAAKVYAHTRDYDTAIARFFENTAGALSVFQLKARIQYHGYYFRNDHVSFIRNNGASEAGLSQEVGVDLKRHAFAPVRVERSPRSLGWVSARNVLDTELTPEKAVYEDFLVLGLRVDKVTVNARLLKAYFNQERIKALQERRKKQLGRDERAALLEKVRLEMMAKQTPATSLHEMAWNLRTHHVYFSATSASLNQEFCDLFGDTFHVALTPLFPFIRADMKAEKEGLAEELRATQASHFSPRARSRMAVEEMDD